MPNDRARNDEQPSTMFAHLLRRIPHNVDAEMALLGGIMLNNSIFGKVADFLKPEHFVLSGHAEIWSAIKGMIDSGDKADPVTLKTFFEVSKEVETLGGADYLFTLGNCAAVPTNAVQYAYLIRDLALRREIIAFGEDMVNKAYSKECPPNYADQIINDASSELFKLSEGQQNSGFTLAADLVPEVIDRSIKALQRNRAGLPNGIRLGFRQLDTMIGGIDSDIFAIIAGRPSMGKTSLAAQIAFNVARDYQCRLAEIGQPKEVLSGGVVAYIPLETGMRSLLRQHWLAQLMDIEGRALRNPDPNMHNEVDILAAGQRARERLNRMPLYVAEGMYTFSAIRNHLLRMKQEKGLGLVIIDYLQLIMPERPGISILQHVTETTRALKLLGVEMDVPIIALSQLSRKCEDRDNKRPCLSDLRESGSIEQDADVVIMCYRHEYYLKADQPQPGSKGYDDAHEKWCEQMADSQNVMEAILAKQRTGPVGTVRMYCDLAHGRITDLDDRRQ